MRLLCLHGVGSSGEIYESQLQPFMRATDPSYEFVFVDGPFRCDRGPGMASWHEGPFYSHTRGYGPGEMAEAMEHLEEAIEERGPFDGVVGFSQGAALAMSYMHFRQAAGQPIAFSFALLFSSVLPCSADGSFGNDLVKRICPLCPKYVESQDALSSGRRLETEADVFINLLQTTIIPASRSNALLPSYDVLIYAGDDISDAPRLMHADLTKERIRIPTVHVQGRQDADFMKKMADAARSLCEEKMLKGLQHTGGHHPPQSEADVRAAVRAMEWAISTSWKVKGLRAA